jgi:leucyl aminopeptidase (aminopeptidase T)
MNPGKWSKLAQRVVQGLGVEPGELVQVRDAAGCYDLLLETLLAVELAGATPLTEILPAEYRERLWSQAPRDYLTNWDRHRQEWVKQSDRILVLLGGDPDFNAAPKNALDVWQQAVHRLGIIDEARRLPFLLAAIPTQLRAQQLGVTLEALEELLLPALMVSVDDLQREIRRVLNGVEEAQAITIESGEGCALHMRRGDRVWLSDDGYIDAADRARGAIVSNLPSGSVYTTVVETETYGSVWLPRAGPARDVLLRFQNGRISAIEAAEGAEAFATWLDNHSGEPRRIGHIGIGLNPYLDGATGWPFVDHCARGRLWISLGENRYMGGRNASSLNKDFDFPHGTLRVNERVIVSSGQVIA